MLGEKLRKDKAELKRVELKNKTEKAWNVIRNRERLT